MTWFAGLLGPLVDLRLVTNRGLDCRDQIAQLDGLAFAEVKNIKERPFIFQRSHHPLDDVVDVGEITSRSPVAELIDRLAGKDAAVNLSYSDVR